MFTDDTQEVTTETVTEETEETTETEAETEETEETSTQTDWEAEAKKWKAIAERRAKPKPIKKEETVSPNSSIEETVLRTLGTDDEQIALLKKLSAINGTSLVDAQKDPLYIALKERREAEKRAQEASVGVSKGSGKKGTKISFNTPGLTEAQHKELWKQAMGR